MLCFLMFFHLMIFNNFLLRKIILSKIFNFVENTFSRIFKIKKKCLPKQLKTMNILCGPEDL